MPAIITTNLPPTTAITTPATPIMVDNIKAFRLVLENARAGQKIIYHTGDLMYDRATNKTNDLSRLADSVYDAYELGRVYLTQKRCGKNTWEYRATVCKE